MFLISLLAKPSFVRRDARRSPFRRRPRSNRLFRFEPLEARRLLSFGSGGIVTTDFGGSDQASSLALQADGKVVAAGLMDTTAVPTRPKSAFAVARYTDSGALDSSFSGDGKLTTSFSGGNHALARATAVQSDGKIVAAGFANGDFALARYNANGSLDTSFGNKGKVTTDFFSGSNDDARALAVLSDGKILAFGTTDILDPEPTNNNGDFALARYTSAGKLDTSFGNGGKVVTDVAPFEIGTAIALQSDEKIVVAGIVTPINGPADFGVVRYNANGSLDTSFGSGGIVTVDASSDYDDIAHAIAVQADGKIVVAGRSHLSPTVFTLVRLNSNGSLDTSFDGDGILTTDAGGGSFQNSGVFAMGIQTDGRIVVAGTASVRLLTGAQEAAIAVARYNSADGSLDGTFGNGGIVVTEIGSPSKAIGSALRLQPDGKIVVAGGATIGSSPDFALVRYNTDGSLDATSSLAGSNVSSQRMLGNPLLLRAATESGDRAVPGGETSRDTVELAMPLHQPPARPQRGGPVITSTPAPSTPQRASPTGLSLIAPPSAVDQALAELTFGPLDDALLTDLASALAG